VEKKYEETVLPKERILAKDKGAIQDELASATLPLEQPYEPKAPFLERLKSSIQSKKQGEKIHDILEVFN
jgi:hypothetical protein